MATKEQITDFVTMVTTHQMWPEFVDYMDKQYYRSWQSGETPEDRELIHAEYKAFRRLTGKLGALMSRVRQSEEVET